MSSQPKNTTTTTAPPSWAIPFIKTGLEGARDYLNGPTNQFYPGQLTPDFSQETLDALQRKQQGVQTDPNVTNNANAFVSATLGGDFLGSNPALEGVLQRIQKSTTDNFNNTVAPSRDAAFARAGRYGSGLHQNAVENSQKVLAEQLGNNANNLLYNNYNDASQRQISALGLVPGLMGQQANQQLSNIGLSSDAGNMVDALNRARAAEEQQRFDFNQNAGYDQLARYFGLINGANVGSTTTKPVYTNPFGQALGLAGLIASPFTGGASAGLVGLGGRSALGGYGGLY